MIPMTTPLPDALTDKHIVLIGMPGSGKSTLGAKLATELGRDLVDTDRLLEQHFERPLQALVDDFGYLGMREREAQMITSLSAGADIIATGGSVVYSPEGMQHLAQIGVIVYLSAGLDTIASRIHNFASRGLARHPDQSLEDLFEERRALYERYANLRQNVEHDDEDTCTHAIIDQLVRWAPSEQ